jgi:hypothetical protein
MDFVIPARLSVSGHQHPEASAWLARLPTLIGELEARWSLTIAALFGCSRELRVGGARQSRSARQTSCPITA